MMTDLDSLLRTVEVQATVIDLLSDALDENTSLLMQHVSTEEAAQLPGIIMMRRAAQLRNSLCKGGGPHEHQ